MLQLSGHCHCGSIHVILEPGRPTADLPLRACQCDFCRRHGAATTSHPQSRLHIEAAPGSLNRYRFGRRVVDALICDECGVYVASTIEADGRRFATLNIAGVALAASKAAFPKSPITITKPTSNGWPGAWRAGCRPYLSKPSRAPDACPSTS